jgi:3-oxoacyl-[acyl-carrier protein] reductase
MVTGAARGIGRAIALELARAGAHLLLHTRRSAAEAEAVASEIRGLGRQAGVVLADLAEVGAHEPLVEAAWAWRGGIDVWINNAGADVLTGEAADWPFDDKLDYLWRVDVRATIRLARLVGRRMKARGPRPDAAVILNLGWDQAEQGMGGDSGEMFAAIKGAVMAFTRSLARSLAPEVRVNCLAPGWIRTAWGQQASDYWQQRALGESLLGRWGTPQDVAAVARFLASPEAGFLTGQIIPVNGGFRGAR